MEPILVVDDEDLVRRVTATILERAGYETASAATAEEAFRLLDERRFSLVVCDLHLPGVSGLELAGRLRGRGLALPVLLVSGGFESDEMQAAEALGALVLGKPFSHAELGDAVAALLAR